MHAITIPVDDLRFLFYRKEGHSSNGPFGLFVMISPPQGFEMAAR
jgi:hypothetical protein